MHTDLHLNKPEPVVINGDIQTYNRNTNIKDAIKVLEAGNPLLVTDFYSNGTDLLKDVQQHLKRSMPNKSFKEQREYREAYRTLSNLVLLEIVNQKIAVKKAPSIGWLQKFYPDNNNFLLPFPQIQGLNSSWQWYQNGVPIPVMRNKLHPYYGTYFPTRFDHLIIFDNWLKRYEGPKKSAIDVGIGSGILSFQLVKYGFQKVFGTDSNSNAIIGLQELMGETKLSRKIELDYGDLFGKWEKETELIVFNPPWLPATHHLDRKDQAIYYDKTLFPNFFKEAKTRLAEDGKLVILFSNLALITKVTKDHPIAKELDKGGRFQLEKRLTRKVKAASSSTKRDQHWRATEEVELWILTHE